MVLTVGEDDNNEVSCECVELTSFPDYLNFYGRVGGDSLNFFHTNIRSFSKNIDDLLVSFNDILLNMDVIVLTECWLRGGEEGMTIDGFDVVNTTKKRNQNDGVIVYVSKRLSAVVSEITLGDVNGLRLDFIFYGKNFNVLALYRTHDSNTNVFFSDLENYYEHMNPNKSCVLLGDINIDLLKRNTTADTYLNCLYGAGLVQYIDKPTRVTQESVSCLDHIFVKCSTSNRVKSAVIQSSITDHFSTGLTITYADSTSDDYVIPTPRYYTDNTQLAYNLTSTDWAQITDCTDLDLCSDLLTNSVQNAINKSKKIINFTSTRFKKIKPWITSGLLISIRSRDKLSKRVKKQPFNNILKNHYLSFRQILSRLIKVAKKDYYRQKIIQSNNNIKVFWGVVNELTGKTKSKDTFPIKKFLLDTPITLDAIKQAANDFNYFFSTIGLTLANQINKGGDPVVNDTDYNLNCHFELKTVTEAEVLKYITKLRGGSAPGFDGVTVQFLKQHIPFIIKPLLHLINLSITSGSFPKNYKIAKVIPLHKSNNFSDKNNFRPISLLNVFSKVLERIVKDQLVKYLQDNNLLTLRQYGFRRDKNINDALFDINREINDSISHGSRTLLVFLDLKKAFDSVDRERLLTKLRTMGIQGNALSWFESYLSDRKQFVAICGVNSELLSVDYGVVQGSTLGPILFLIYMNNISKINLNGTLYLFADDTLLSVQGLNWQDTYNKASSDLAVLKRWLNQNVLSLNISKTKFLPISLSNKTDYNLQNLKIHDCGDISSIICTCKSIENVTHYKYLGIYFDKRLSWSNHIDYLVTRLRKYYYAFREIGGILEEGETKIAYFAYIQSILSFGNLAWGGSRAIILNPLFVAQKRLLKIAFKKNLRYPTEQLFKETSILTVRQLYIKTLLIHIFTNRYSILTPTQHVYSTRYAQNTGVSTLQLRKHYSTTNPYYIANVLYRNICNFYNNLHLFSSQSLQVFKKRLKDWLMTLSIIEAETIINTNYRPL